MLYIHGICGRTQVFTLYSNFEQQWNGHEEFEGKLVRINNVTITGSGNFFRVQVDKTTLYLILRVQWKSGLMNLLIL